MPRPGQKYVQKETSRHGKVVWYFRKGDGPRIRLSGLFGSKEWGAAYDAALLGVPMKPTTTGSSGTVSWLVGKNKASILSKQLVPLTQKMRGNVLKGICATAGNVRLRRR